MTMHKQPSLNSSTNIFFQILFLYPLEQKLDGRLAATWRLRSSYNHPICISNIVLERLSSTKQQFGILQQTSSSKPYILLSRNLMEGFMQHGDSEMLKSFHLHIKDCLALNSHLGILRTSSSSKPYILLSRNLIGGRRLNRKAEIIPLRCQRGSSIKQPSWNSSTNIFQTIYPLEQKLDGRPKGCTEKLKSFH